VLFTLDARRLDVFALNEIDGQLFLGTRDGTVIAVREIKGKYDDQEAAKTSSDGKTGEAPVLIE